MSRNIAALSAVNHTLPEQAKALDAVYEVYKGLCAAVRQNVAIEKLDVMQQIAMSLEVLAQARGEAVNDG